MSTELSDKMTPVTNSELIEALWYGWLHVFGTPPKKEAIWILMSQWALETGWGKSMHNYNLGNAKSRDGDGFDYSYFKCNEIVPTKYGEQLQSSSPQTAKITCYRQNGTCIIWFYPKHPGCRFRAFNSLLEGAIDHIGLVYKRFNKSWPALLTGDPDLYAVALKSQGYYTADVHTPNHTGYADVLVKIYHTVQNIEFDYDSLSNVPVNDNLSENDRQRLENMVQLTLQQSINDYLGDMHSVGDTDVDELKNV